MSRAVEYLDLESPVHSLNPLTKLTGVLTFFFMGLIFSHPLLLSVLVGFVVIIFIVARAGRILASYIRPLVSVSAIMLIIQILFSHEGPELVRFLPRNIPVLGWIGSINGHSLLLGLTMVTRMMIFGLSLPLLLATTQPRDLVLVLVERLRFPYQYAFMFITALRFIPTLFVEIDQIIQAQSARAFEIENKSLIKKIKAYIPLVTPLVIIALKKAERLAVAMETRGYGLGPRTYLRKPSFSRQDVVVCACSAVFTVLSITLKIMGLGA